MIRQQHLHQRTVSRWMQQPYRYRLSMPRGRRKSRRRGEKISPHRNSWQYKLTRSRKAVRFQFCDKHSTQKSSPVKQKSINYVTLPHCDLLASEAFSLWALHSGDKQIEFSFNLACCESARLDSNPIHLRYVIYWRSLADRESLQHADASMSGKIIHE